MNKTENEFTDIFNTLTHTSHTMFMTLAARASSSALAPGTDFYDPYAVELFKQLPIDLSLYTKDPLLVKSVALRALLMDTLALDFITKHPGTTGVSLGCGLCSRGQRIRDKLEDSISFRWYDIDLPEVIQIRDHYGSCFPSDTTIGCSLTDFCWLDRIDRKKGQPLLLVMEGVASYFSFTELKSLFMILGERLSFSDTQTVLIFDYAHPAFMGGNNPFTITENTKVVFQSGFTNGKAVSLLHPSIRIKAEHHFIENISGEHAAFNREFLKKTGGEHPYTVAELCFDYQLCKKMNKENPVLISPEKVTGKADGSTHKINWNPCFYPALLSPTRLILAGETNSFLLEGEQYQDLFARMDGNTTKEEIVLQSDHSFIQTNLLFTIEKLMANGFILEICSNNSRYILPEFTGKPEEYQSGSGDTRLFLLSQSDNRKLFFRWFEKIKSHHPLSIVIVDDYLDPRLNQIQKDHLRENRPWILVKPTGKQPLTGPYFIPGNNQSPCLECLIVRMLQNQPVRRWLQDLENKKIMPLPIFVDEKKIHHALTVAAKKIEFMVHNTIFTLLWSLSPFDSSGQSHTLLKRPQCKVCGDPSIVSRQTESPLTLKPCMKISGSDGGTRTIEPSRTLQNCNHLISPLTGIINDVSQLPDQDEKGIIIFRTAFFKTPTGNLHPEHKDFFQVSLGKGIKKEQSKASALCESIERFAAHYQGDEFCIRKRSTDLDAPAIHPGELVLYSEKQHRRFQDLKEIEKKYSHTVSAYDPAHPLQWTICWSLTQNQKQYLPFTYCYYNTPFETDAVIRYNSNGSAAGNTPEEAILQGLLELIERDATAIWWYNRVCCPGVDLKELDKETVQLFNTSLEKEWDYWVLDITHDFRIPVMAAIGRHKKTKQFRFGFGSHLNAPIACRRALTELCQLIAIKDNGSKKFDFKRILPEAYLFPAHSKGEKSLSGFSDTEQPDITEDIRYCVNQVEKPGLKVFVHNYSRPDLPLHTVKVIVPGLCHIWPQFGNPRLYDVPVKLGWLDRPLEEDGLNPLGLFV